MLPYTPIFFDDGELTVRVLVFGKLPKLSVASCRRADCLDVIAYINEFEDWTSVSNEVQEFNRLEHIACAMDAASKRNIVLPSTFPVR